MLETNTVTERPDTPVSSHARPVQDLREWLARAKEIALEIAENTAPVSVAITRQMLWHYSNDDDPFELLKMDGPLSLDLGAGGDVKEGVTAFLEKRKPNFPGKVTKDIPVRWKKRTP